MDSAVVISIILVVIAALIIVQIIKRLFKLVTLGVCVACLVFGISYATNALSTNYGVVFDSTSGTVSMPFTSEYSSEYRQLVYDVKQADLTLYSGNEPISSFNQSDIDRVQLANADSLQTIQIQYGDQKIDMSTSESKAKVLYSILKTLKTQGDIKFEIQDITSK